MQKLGVNPVASKFWQSKGTTMLELAMKVAVLATTVSWRWKRSKVKTHAFGRDEENLVTS